MERLLVSHRINNPNKKPTCKHENQASIDVLPPEIITNILSRLHFKLMGQCKCVSKLWYSVLSHPTFPTTDHLSQLPHFSPDLLLHFKSEMGSSRMYYLEDNPSLNKRPIRPLKLLDESSLAHFFPEDARILGSCNGFICYLRSVKSLTSLDVETSIYVFNPLTEERAKLPPLPIPNPHKPYIRKWLSGFGIDESRNEYKLVFIVSVNNNKHQKSLEVRYQQVLVHILGSSSWSKIDTEQRPLTESDATVSSAFVNGSLHWIASLGRWMIPKKHLSLEGLPTGRLLLIVAFNLCSEKFIYVRNPEPFVFKMDQRSYEVGSLKGCLSVVECFNTSNDPFINIWIMEKYNVRKSWVKLFSLQQQVFPGCSEGLCKPIKFLKNGELLLLSRGRHMIRYDPKKKTARFISLGWAGKRQQNVLEIHLLVGTLISVKTTFGLDTETKKTTSLQRES